MKRYGILDEIRGLTLLSMIGFHAVWDLVYLFDVEWDWFYTDIAYIWQQSICWVFILLSGFCCTMGRHLLKRGLLVLGAGCVISLVTELVMPEQRVCFGVLTLLGVSMLLMIPLEKVLKRIPAVAGMIGSVLCFVVTRNLNRGELGFEGLRILDLPDRWYHVGMPATFIGFTDVSFYSSDYFSLFPWIFLFVTGYFLYRIATSCAWLEKWEKFALKSEPLQILGRHSLILYLVHQPLLYGGLSAMMYIINKFVS